ncbi:MAG: hypothetical protein A2583_00055 [Bdellovibrionales bacterium RIFOXYD1_FULL_53_11]|nr:MAG: hypothetical protein A2583_00055 [Bdellovibrionales bacterium RIFOXYD1_FULL_53_11]
MTNCDHAQAGGTAYKARGMGRNEQGRSFWQKLVYSRLVSWGREYNSISYYFSRNFFESRNLWLPARAFVDHWLDSMMAAGVGPPGYC